MALVLVICLLVTVLPRSFETCSILQNCTMQLHEFINRTQESKDISTKISLCLNVVDKQSSLHICEMDAVKNCPLVGHEPEYISYRKQKYGARSQCLEDCPNMDDVKICQGKIKFEIIHTEGYASFCSQYLDVQTTCVDTKLSKCSFRHQLFESGLSGDSKRIVQTICQSGCLTIDKTTEIIGSCNKQYSVTAGDGKLFQCSFYNEYINCIQRESPCSEFKQVAQYSQSDFLQARDKCDPTTTSSSSAASSTTTPLIITTTVRRSTMLNSTPRTLGEVTTTEPNEKYFMTTSVKAGTEKFVIPKKTESKDMTTAIIRSDKTGNLLAFLTTKSYDYTVKKQNTSSDELRQNIFTDDMSSTSTNHKITQSESNKDITNEVKSTNSPTKAAQKVSQSSSDFMTTSVKAVTEKFVIPKKTESKDMKTAIIGRDITGKLQAFLATKSYEYTVKNQNTSSDGKEKCIAIPIYC